MTGFENDLARDLTRLADDLTPGHLPSADAARACYRRARATRIGVAATVLAIAIVGAGIPVGSALLANSSGSGGVAGQPQVTSRTNAVTTAPAPATSTPPAAPGTPTDAAWQTRLADAAGLAAQLTGPIQPSVPVPFDSCPDIVSALTTKLGLQIEPDGGEGGTTEPYMNVCMWATPDTVAETSAPSTWFGMTVHYMPDVAPDDLRDRYFLCDQGGPCPTVDAPNAGPDAFLVTNLESDFQYLDLVVPDASGDGIWIIDAYRGINAAGPSLLENLNATSTALSQAFPTP